MSTVTLEELRSNLLAVIERVEAGESVVLERFSSLCSAGADVRVRW
jgi:hypothetical protein